MGVTKPIKEKKQREGSTKRKELKQYKQKSAETPESSEAVKEDDFVPIKPLKNDLIEEEDPVVLSRKQLRKKAKAKGADGDSENDTKPQSASNPSTSAPVARSPYGVWIGNLSFKTTTEELRDWIATHLISVPGTITRVHMKHGINPNENNKGWAYVDFDNAEMANKAVELSEQNLAGRKLLIKLQDDFKGRPIAPTGADAAKTVNLAGQISAIVASYRPLTTALGKKEQQIASHQKQAPCATLFIGNLPFETTSESLQELFEAHHRAPIQPKDKESDKWAEPGIKRVRLGTFEDSGKCKGWAFLDFVTVEQATMALLNSKNHTFNGRDLKVEYASEEAARRGADRPKGQHAKKQGGKEQYNSKDKYNNKKGKRKLEEGTLPESSGKKTKFEAPATDKEAPAEEAKNNGDSEEQGKKSKSTVPLRQRGLLPKAERKAAKKERQAEKASEKAQARREQKELALAAAEA